MAEENEERTLCPFRNLAEQDNTMRMESCKQKSSPKMKKFYEEKKGIKSQACKVGKFCRPRKL